jgi:hypothetical protein
MISDRALGHLLHRDCEFRIGSHAGMFYARSGILSLVSCTLHKRTHRSLVPGPDLSIRNKHVNRGHHSMTSSARASNDGGTVMPSAFAVFRLITSSYLVGTCTGRSPGFSPLRMRSA